MFKKPEEEKTEYLKIMAHLRYEISPKQVQFFGYELAVAYIEKILTFYKFMKRTTTISVRSAEATYLVRPWDLIKFKFFSNLKTLYENYKYTPAQIYNIDATGPTTVQGCSKVVASKIQKIGTSIKWKRYPLVTMVGQHFKAHMAKGGPPGVQGDISPSSWINEEIFHRWFQHFINRMLDHQQNTR